MCGRARSLWQLILLMLLLLHVLLLWHIVLIRDILLFVNLSGDRREILLLITLLLLI